ncbi:MarR family winged helix-turn-helix transcriptional regulator [Nocardioides montaniterrae]
MDSRMEAFNALQAELGVLVGRTRRGIAARAHQVHPELQAGSYLILGHVQAHGPLRATTVGEIFAIDKGSVSRHVQQLVDLGLMTRATDPQDRRAQLLSVTPEGARRLDEVHAARREGATQKLESWSVEDIETLAAGLHRFNITFA